MLRPAQVCSSPLRLKRRSAQFPRWKWNLVGLIFVCDFIGNQICLIWALEQVLKADMFISLYISEENIPRNVVAE